MLVAIAWLVSILFLALLTGWVLRLLELERPALELAGAIFLWIFLATLSTFVAGLMGWLRPAPLLLISLVGLAALLILARTYLRVTFTREMRSGMVRRYRPWWNDLPPWLKVLTLSAAVLSLARFGFLIWALPPFVWDSLSYHLTNVAHWIQAGRIEIFETPVARIFNPANYEVLAAWFAVFPHHDAVIEAAGLPAYALAIVAVYAAARGLGRSRSASTLAGLGYASTPALILAATGTKNDIHIAAYYLLGLALIVDLARRSREASAPRVLPRTILLALAVLLAIGTKTYILHLIPGLLLAGLLMPGTRLGAWLAAARSAAQEFRALPRPARLAVAALLLAGLLLGGYWNLRNWAVTGNPFYPYDVMLAGRMVFAGPDSEFRLSLGELGANLESIAAKFGDRLDPIRPDLPNTTGWGWFAYAVGLPALAWALVRRPQVRALAAGFGLSFVLLMLSTGPSPWNMRFAIWFPAVFALGFAELADSIPTTLPRAVSFGLVGYLLLLLGLNFASTLNYNRVPAEEFRLQLGLPVRERHAARFPDNMPDSYALAVEVVPPEAVLGYNVHGNGFVYPLYLADFSRRIEYIPFGNAEGCAAIAQTMAARGTRYLLVAPEHTEDRLIARLEACAREATDLRERASEIYVIAR